LHARLDLPDDTRLWAALQAVSGGAWGGAVYDVERIIATLDAGEKALGNTQKKKHVVNRLDKEDKPGKRNRRG
jgi:hypothetical protein